MTLSPLSQPNSQPLQPSSQPETAQPTQPETSTPTPQPRVKPTPPAKPASTSTQPQAVISLKIQFEDRTKVFRFGTSTSVSEALAEIAEKSSDPSYRAELKRYGLYSPPNPETGKKAFWLGGNRALSFYGFQNEVLPSSPLLFPSSFMRSILL